MYKKDVDQDKDWEDVPKLKAVEVALAIVIYLITMINKYLRHYLLLYQQNNLEN